MRQIESTHVAVGKATAGLVKAAVFFIIAKLLIEVPIYLNRNLSATIPWSIPVGAVLLTSWTIWVAPKWMGNTIGFVRIRGHWAVALVILSVVFSLCILAVSGALFSMIGVGQSAGLGASWELMLAWALAYPIFGAVYEEIAFRGILQGHLEPLLGSNAALVAATCLFVGLHAWNPGFWPQFAYYAAIGVTAGLAIKTTRSVVPAIAIHAIPNAMLAVLATSLGRIEFGRFPAWLTGIVAALTFCAGAGIRIAARGIRPADLHGTAGVIRESGR
jgi:membrane protease YdiL (CAAX protease family)